GLLKFTLLKTLNASPRSSSLRRSVSGKTLCKAKSVWKKPGPVKMFRPAPYPPTSGVVNIAFSASLKYVTADTPFTRVPIEVGLPAKTAFVLTIGNSVPRPEDTVMGNPLDQSMIVLVDQPPTTHERIPLLNHVLPAPNGSS